MSKQSGFGSVILAALLAGGAPAQAQGVATPAPVQGQPLAPPSGGAQAQAEPRPVEQPPVPGGPVVPQPVAPPPAAPVPAQPQPIDPPPSLPVPDGAAPPAPAVPPAPIPPPAVSPQQQAGPADPESTLAGRKGDPSDVDEIVLAPKPVLIRPGEASWDEGFKALSGAIAALREQAQKLGLPVAGRPLSLFVETTDNGFRFEAMLPVARAPDGALPEGFRAGTTPEGKAFRFVHYAPYDDIDSTYETITAYLEAKNQVVKDAFLEEYVSDLKDPGDPNLEINVYVQPR